MQKAGAFEVISKEQSVQELYAAIQRAVAAVQPVLILEETPSTEETASSDVEQSDKPSQTESMKEPKI